MSETTLLDLLGRQWALGTPVDLLAFDQGDMVAGFVLNDKRIALAPVTDTDPAANRYHIAGDDGRATIANRRKPVPPITQVVVQGQGLRIVPCGPEGFLVGTDSGTLNRLATDGALTAMVGCGAPVHSIAALPDGMVLIAAGTDLFMQDAQGISPRRVIVLEAPASPLAVTADGRWLGHGGDGLTIRASCDGFPIAGHIPEFAASQLAWSPDGRWLAASLMTGGIALVGFEDGRIGPVRRLSEYPAPVRSLSWDGSSRLLATSGAFRIIVWPLEQITAEGADLATVPAGRGGLVAVDVVAIHPRRSLVAAGYADGMVVVAQIGGRDQLVVRPSREGAIVGLCWTRSGEHLAFGTTTGDAAIVSFPPLMFK